jgi:hypothetical protein
MLLRRCALLSALLVSGGAHGAATPISEPSLRWNARASVAAVAASGSHDLDHAGVRAGPAARMRIDVAGSAGKGVLEAARYGRQSGYESGTLLRQAYWAGNTGPLHIRAGRQIVAWGRADRINPSDNLAPRNRRALVTDADEERLGTDMLSASWNLRQSWSLSGYWVPRMPASAIPRNVVRQLTTEPLRPRAATRTIAAKLDYAGSGFDGSVSFLDGAALLPVLVPADAGITVKRPAYRVLAGDFSWQFAASWGLRGELAVTRFDDGASGWRARSGLADFRHGVFGVERQLDDGWTAIAQYVGRRVSASGGSPVASPLQQLNRAIWFQARGDDDALMIGVTKSPFDDDWSGHVGMLRSVRHNDMALFMRLEWRISDIYSLRLRHETFRGPPDTNFGALRRNSATIAELRATWGW